MMTALRISPLGRRPVDTLPGLRVSAYERAASWLLAWLLLTGAVASCLFVVWLGMHEMLPAYRSVSVSIQPMNGTGSQEEIGQDMSLAWPGADETAAESDLSEPEFESLLKTVIDAAALRAAQLGDEAPFEDEPHGRGGQEGTASGVEKRLYISWRGGARKEADRSLAAKASVPSGKVLLQFFPREIEELLLRVEHDYRNRDAATIRKTRFGLRPAGNDYEFFVIEQGYL